MTTNISSSAKIIATSICPACGCSLVRLGIGADRWAKSNYEGKEYFFCCQGCTDLFNQDPTCLAEKPVQWTVRMEISGWEVFFCRCPYCLDVFRKDPDHYVKRLQGEIPYKGVFGEAGCCPTET